MKNLAVILARSGLKGLPDKNIKNMAGKPLLAYTIEVALESGVFDTVTLLQPTSSLRDDIDIKHAFKVFQDNEASSVVSVCEVDHSPLLCNNLPEDNSLNGFIDVDKVGRRQDMKTFYRINGAIYIQKTSALMNRKTPYGEKSYAYIMDKSHSIDIDDKMDFLIAETIMEENVN